jgi:hypothetical protein
MRQFTQPGCSVVVALVTVVCVLFTITELANARSYVQDVSSSMSFVRTGVSEASTSFRNNTIDPFMKLEAMREFRALLQRERERKDRRKAGSETVVRVARTVIPY